MPRSSGQHKQDVAALLKKHRQDLAAWQEQLEDFEKRLQTFRWHQHALQEQIEMLRQEREYLTGLKQEHKQQERRWH